MRSKEMFYFTGKCLALDDHPAFSQEIIQYIHSGKINWNQFVYLCSSHLILPAIYLKFRVHGIISHLPPELAEFLKEIHRLNLSRNNQILLQLKEITCLLNEHEIKPTFLKGTGNLLEGLYSDMGERIMGDIDLLVTEKDYFRAVAIMKKDGYQTDSPVYFDVENLKHYPCLSKPGATTHIEIHRLAVSDAYGKWFNPAILDQEKKTVSTLQGCYVLSDKHKIIHNFIHSQLGHKGHLYGIASFRDLFDIYLLSKRSKIEFLLPEIESKSKAIAYFVFASKALGLREKLISTTNMDSRLFIQKHDLNMSSQAFFQIHRTLVYLAQRILMGYLQQFFKSFYSKSIRRSVINRLTNPKWYKAHVSSYTAFFSPQK